MKSVRVTIQMKANEQFPVVLFIMLQHVQDDSNSVGSMDEIVKRDPSNESF